MTTWGTVELLAVELCWKLPLQGTGMLTSTLSGTSACYVVYTPVLQYELALRRNIELCGVQHASQATALGGRAYVVESEN